MIKPYNNVYKTTVKGNVVDADSNPLIVSKRITAFKKTCEQRKLLKENI